MLVGAGKIHFADQCGLLALIRLPLIEVNPATLNSHGSYWVYDIGLSLFESPYLICSVLVLLAYSLTPIYMSCMIKPIYMSCMIKPIYMSCMIKPIYMSCMIKPIYMSCMIFSVQLKTAVAELHEAFKAKEELMQRCHELDLQVG